VRLSSLLLASVRSLIARCATGEERGLSGKRPAPCESFLHSSDAPATLLHFPKFFPFSPSFLSLSSFSLPFLLPLTQSFFSFFLPDSIHLHSVFHPLTLPHFYPISTNAPQSLSFRVPILSILILFISFTAFASFPVNKERTFQVAILYFVLTVSSREILRTLW